MFETSAFSRLIRELQQCKRAGRSLIATTELQVLDNAWWGVVGGRKVRVLWVYNDRVLDWEARLDRATGIPTAIEAGNQVEPYGPFRYLPSYLTEGQNISGSIALTPQQINLLAELSCWNVTSRAARMMAFLDDELVGMTLDERRGGM